MASDLVERARDESDPYGLVLVDWKMPFLDGVETARRLHGEAPETAVVLITAFDEDEVREKAKNVGARDVLNKPVFESALVDLLDRLRKDGLDVPLTALTVEECADAILAAVSK